MTAVRRARRVSWPSGEGLPWGPLIHLLLEKLLRRRVDLLGGHSGWGREETMQYLIQWHLSEPQLVRAAAQRFLKTGGKPPEGATQIGRWFGMNGKGCAVIEASDPKPVFEMVSEWQEFMQWKHQRQQGGR